MITKAEYAKAMADVTAAAGKNKPDTQMMMGYWDVIDDYRRQEIMAHHADQVIPLELYGFAVGLLDAASTRDDPDLGDAIREVIATYNKQPK